MADQKYLELPRHNRALAFHVFSAAALAPLWLKKIQEWEMLPA